MEFIMTETNDTEMRIYHQLIEVRRCIDALKDVSENMPNEDRYCAVLGIITERLDSEFINLMPMALSSRSSENKEIAISTSLN
jgi:hypothetical protein